MGNQEAGVNSTQCKNGCRRNAPLHTTLINSNVTLERSVSACQSVCVLLLAVGGWRAYSRRCRPIYPHGDGFIVCCGPGGVGGNLRGECRPPHDWPGLAV